MKKFILSCLFLIFLPLFQRPVLAEEIRLEECQKYYQFGKVKVNLNTKRSSCGPGEKIELFGTIVNKNTFPLLDITIFAHLKRINQETLLANGHFLIDRLILAQDLNFLPQETKELSFEFPVLPNYPQDQYQLQYFVFSKQGFYYSGRPFLEQDFAGVTNFEIKDTSLPEVFFDLDTLTLDGVPQPIRDYIPIFGKDQNSSIAIMIKDSGRKKSNISVVHKWYRQDDSFEENLIKTGSVDIYAGQPLMLQTVFDFPEPGAYVLLLEINNPVRSLFQFRVARRGKKAYNLKMDDLGITNYPVDPQKDRAFVCFHSSSEENSPQTKVALSLLDKEGQILEQKAVEDSFGGGVMAISIPLTKLTDSLNFSIEANFQDLENPSLSQKLRHNFDCHLFDQSLSNLSTAYQAGKINLLSTNLCGHDVNSAYAEKLIIYQDGQIKKEEYHLRSIPSEIDISDLPDGNYRLLVKSGEVERKMDFRVEKRSLAKKEFWLLIILGVLFLTGLGVIVIKKRKKNNET